MGDRKHKAGKVDVHSFNLLPTINGKTVESVTYKSQGSILTIAPRIALDEVTEKDND